MGHSRILCAQEAVLLASGDVSQFFEQLKPIGADTHEAAAFRMTRLDPCHSNRFSAPTIDQANESDVLLDSLIDTFQDRACRI